MKLTVGSTLYWAPNREEYRFICCVNAFDLVNQNSYEESLHTDNIFGRHEVLDSVRPDLLNFPDGNFCLILRPKRMKRKKKNGRFARGALYIYCVILKVDKEEEEEEEEEEVEEGEEEEEEDDDIYKHGLRVSILSVHKYSEDDWIPLLESVLV